MGRLRAIITWADSLLHFLLFGPISQKRFCAENQNFSIRFFIFPPLYHCCPGRLHFPHLPQPRPCTYTHPALSIRQFNSLFFYPSEYHPKSTQTVNKQLSFPHNYNLPLQPNTMQAVHNALRHFPDLSASLYWKITNGGQVSRSIT